MVVANSPASSRPLAEIELAIERLGPVTVAQRLWRQAGTTFATIIVKTTFRLEHGGRARLVDTEPFAGQESVVADSEHAPYLPSTGVTLTGFARAPARTVTRQMSVRACIRAMPTTGRGEPTVLLDKSLLVVGNRGAPDQISDVFDEIPLIDELAVGGPGFDENPIGVGLGGDGSQANILPPDSAAAFVGFGPVHRDRPSRRALLGGVAFNPGLLPLASFPDEVDWRYFHVAPRDQQVPYLTGREWIRLEGFDAKRAAIESEMPAVAPRARVRRGARGPCEEIAFRADYLKIDAEEQTCSLCWRGHAAVPLDALGDLRALVGLEREGEPIVWPKGWASASPAIEARGTRGASTSTAPSSGRPSAPPDDDEDVYEAKTIAAQPRRSLRSTKVLAADDIAEALQRPDTPFRPSSPPEIGPPSSSAPSAPAYPKVAVPPALGPSLMGPPPSAPAPPRPPARLNPPVEPAAPPSGGIATPSFLLDAREAIARPFPPPAFERSALRTAVSRAAAVCARVEVRSSPRRSDVLARIEAGEPLEGLDLSGTDLSGIDFAGLSLRGTNLCGTVLRESVLQDANLSDALLEGADLTDADLSGANLERAALRRTNLSRTNLERAKLGDTAFDEAIGRGATFRGATGARTVFAKGVYDECDFTGIEIERADFTESTFSSSRLSHAKLERARFEKATLKRVSLDGARMPSSKWCGAKLDECSCRQSSFARSQFERAELDCCRFHASDLRDANLRGARCADVDLSAADLREVDLDGATLTRVRFDEAQLMGASLRSVVGEGISFDAAKLAGADLTRASVPGASLIGAQLRGARADGVDLGGADLTRADLSLASLRGATLARADLSFALVEGADLSGANLTAACMFRVDQARARLTGANLEGIDTTTDKRQKRTAGG